MCGEKNFIYADIHCSRRDVLTQLFLISMKRGVNALRFFYIQIKIKEKNL